jgi:hypothetical protein
MDEQMDSWIYKPSILILHYERMDGWMDGWMDRWMDGWMDGWTDRWTDGWTDI